MDRYLIIVPHTVQECLAAVRQIEAIGALTHFDWGCKDGEHTGWVILEAENKPQALMVVPTLQRTHARVIKLVKFTPEDLQSAHP